MLIDFEGKRFHEANREDTMDDRLRQQRDMVKVGVVDVNDRTIIKRTLYPGNTLRK